jgi:hypothetical protein
VLAVNADFSLLLLLLYLSENILKIGVLIRYDMNILPCVLGYYVIKEIIVTGNLVLL